MNEAVKAGIDAALEVEGVISISAGNYDGKLWRQKYLIY